MPADTMNSHVLLRAVRIATGRVLMGLCAAGLTTSAQAAAKAEAPKPAAIQTMEAAPLPPGADAQALEAALKALDAPQKELGVTQAILVAHKGALVAERYGRSLDADSRLNSWTIGSAITAALTGRALQTGVIKSLDEPAGLTEWTIAGDDRRNVTLRNLLAMNSGLQWTERNARSPTGSDAEKMLFAKGRFNVVAYAASRKIHGKAGAHFVYSTGSSVLLAAAIQRRLPPLTLVDGKRTFAMRKFITADLFDKLGMTSAAPQFDIAGNYYSDLLWATPRDLARFGQFCLQDGVWTGQRLLPEGWIQSMRTPSGAKDGQSYGAGFWIKSKDKPDALMASLPADAFAAGGDHGAVIVMIPSKDLVIVRLGITPWGEKSRSALGAWLGEVAGAFPG